MAYEIEGTLKVIMEPKTFDSGFTVREFVLTVEDGKYPQDIILQVVQDKVSVLDEVSEGDTVSATFDVRGREYNGRYFNNLQAWKVDKVGSAAPVSDDPPADDSDGGIPF